MRRLISVLLMGVLLAGCAAGTPAIRPVEARTRVLSHPYVAAWFAERSAPRVLTGMSPLQFRRWRRYEPAMVIDVVREGLQVRLESRFGPPPHMLEVLLDRQTGHILTVTDR